MKPRDRRIRTERARQERRARLQKEKDRRHEATKETALRPSSNDSLISTSSNPTAPGPPSIYAAIDSHEATGGAQSTTPGHAFQLTQAEQEAQRGLEQEQSSLPEFDELGR